MDAAHASFEEDVKVSIEVGKFANMIILSDNLLETRPDAAAKVEPLLTIVVGKEVCRSYRFPR
jgi:predicted amidohydrolase YtcJ